MESSKNLEKKILSNYGKISSFLRGFDHRNAFLLDIEEFNLFLNDSKCKTITIG